MPPEDELCLLLARARLSPEARERALSLLAGWLEWPCLIERAKGFGLFPLLYTRLEALGFPGVPDTVRAEWTIIFRNHAMRTELVAMELARILRLLGASGIPAMPLKGVALAEWLYGDSALRVSDDIDILVPTRRASETFHLLVSSGFQSEFTSQPRLLELAVLYGRDCLLTTRESGYIASLELHSALVWGGSLDCGLLEQVWREAQRITFRGVPAFALSPEWTLLYLAIIAGRHGGSSLKWYADLDRLCCRESLDWEKASEKAKRLGWEGAVQSSLETCGYLFETPLGPPFSPGPQRPRARFPRPSDLLSPSDNLFLFGLLNTPTRKLRYIATRLFIPTIADCRFLPLPQPLFFVYYLLRPVRQVCVVAGWLVQAGMKGLWRRLHLRKEGQ